MKNRKNVYNMIHEVLISVGYLYKLTKCKQHDFHGHKLRAYFFHLSNKQSFDIDKKD